MPLDLEEDLAQPADPGTTQPFSRPPDPALLTATLSILAAARGRGTLAGIVAATSWSPDWTQALQQAWENLRRTMTLFSAVFDGYEDRPVPEDWMVTRCDGHEKQRFRSSDRTDIAATARAVQQREPVCIIKGSPDDPLAPWVAAAVDVRLQLAPPGPDAIERVIERVAGGKPTVRLRPDLCAALTPDALRLAVRPGQSPDDYVWRLSKLARRPRRRRRTRFQPSPWRACTA